MPFWPRCWQDDHVNALSDSTAQGHGSPWRGIRFSAYYFGRWIGRKTANGEIYRAADVTAAHKTLPFHTMVRVTNLKNGKSVIVRINNRGPYVKGRIIDLSLVAAQRIEMTKAGVVPVLVEVLRKIEVLPKPNRQLTAREKRTAEKRAAEKAGKEKPDTRSGIGGVFSFLRSAP
jgi:rare lipoprotein A